MSQASRQAKGQRPQTQPAASSNPYQGQDEEQRQIGQISSIIGAATVVTSNASIPQLQTPPPQVGISLRPSLANTPIPIPGGTPRQNTGANAVMSPYNVNFSQSRQMPAPAPDPKSGSSSGGGSSSAQGSLQLRSQRLAPGAQITMRDLLMTAISGKLQPDVVCKMAKEQLGKDVPTLLSSEGEITRLRIHANFYLGPVSDIFPHASSDCLADYYTHVIGRGCECLGNPLRCDQSMAVGILGTPTFCPNLTAYLQASKAPLAPIAGPSYVMTSGMEIPPSHIITITRYKELFLSVKNGAIDAPLVVTGPDAEPLRPDQAVVHIRQVISTLTCPGATTSSSSSSGPSTTGTIAGISWYLLPGFCACTMQLPYALGLVTLNSLEIQEKLEASLRARGVSLKPQSALTKSLLLAPLMRAHLSGEVAPVCEATFESPLPVVRTI